MKKSVIIAILTSIFAVSSYGQPAINITDFEINGVKFISTKEDIRKKFGNPLQKLRPMYECGSLSENPDCHSEPIYSLIYKNFKFTGNEIYILEEITINSNSIIAYKGLSFSGISMMEFEKLFSVKVEKNQSWLQIIGSDDTYIFYFKNNLLHRIEYWSPC